MVKRIRVTSWRKIDEPFEQMDLRCGEDMVNNLRRCGELKQHYEENGKDMVNKLWSWRGHSSHLEMFFVSNSLWSIPSSWIF